MNSANVGARLMTLRKTLGLSQSLVSKHLGIDQTTLSKIESGERAIGMSSLEKLSELYCVPVKELLDDSAEISKVQLAFRTTEMTDEDLIILSKVNRIIINQKYMDKLQKG